mmetsp:Transcript_2664/g.8929  ORF Transcript_2664/g.8929 Transcript_2664/m.8929 type:complete len:211 (-) Transcript_2664:968-1600(-)
MGLLLCARQLVDVGSDPAIRELLLLVDQVLHPVLCLAQDAEKHNVNHTDDAFVHCGVKHQTRGAVLDLEHKLLKLLCLSRAEHARVDVVVLQHLLCVLREALRILPCIVLQGGLCTFGVDEVLLLSLCCAPPLKLRRLLRLLVHDLKEGLHLKILQRHGGGLPAVLGRLRVLQPSDQFLPALGDAGVGPGLLDIRCKVHLLCLLLDARRP